MMKFIQRIVYALIAVILFLFAIKNTQDAQLNFFLGMEIQKPIVLFLFLFFLVGAILGIFGMLPAFVRQRRDISRLKKTIADLHNEKEAMLAHRAQPPQPDSVPNK